MNEGFKPTNENVESLDVWRTLKEEAPDRAKELLAEHTIPINLKEVSFEEVIQSIERLTALLDELSQDNENRYVARELSLYCEQMKKFSEYKKVPAPAFVQIG